MTDQAGDDLLRAIAEREIHSVRVVFTDQHGLLRGKTVDASVMARVLIEGVGVPSSLLHKDTGGTYALPIWTETGDPVLDAFVGARNLIMRPDPATFRVLPWVEGTGLVLCDLETVGGDPIPHSTRGLCSAALDRLGERGYRLRAGLELEFHLYRIDETRPSGVEYIHPGWDLLGEEALDRVESAVAPIRDGLRALGVAPRTIEIELGPSQVEMTFAPAAGLAVADEAVLIRTAIKQLARRNGCVATFMSRPGVEDAFPSGWHLHQSLVGPDDTASLFAQADTAAASGGVEQTISKLGAHYVAGLLEHATESCLLSTPTITGYKRYRPRAVAPDRISWSDEHRGAMLRVVGGPGDPATRVENRAGDPAANPYLYLASQVVSGSAGIDAGLIPPSPTDTPYTDDGGELLPRSLGEAIDAFDTSTLYRKFLGDHVVDYLVALKRSEWQRFLAAVTDWEQSEYFAQF